jgi:hypothetical protein
MKKKGKRYRALVRPLVPVLTAQSAPQNLTALEIAAATIAELSNENAVLRRDAGVIYAELLLEKNQSKKLGNIVEYLRHSIARSKAFHAARILRNQMFKGLGHNYVNRKSA